MVFNATNITAKYGDMLDIGSKGSDIFKNLNTYSDGYLAVMLYFGILIGIVIFFMYNDFNLRSSFLASGFVSFVISFLLYLIEMLDWKYIILSVFIIAVAGVFEYIEHMKKRELGA